MSKNCNEPDFDTLVSKVLGTIPFGIAMMLDEVEENANNINQKEERVKQNTKEHTEGRSYGCSHKCHNPWHKPYLKKFVNLEKETNENSCCQHQQKETVEVGKKYNLRNANYFAKLDEEVRNSEVFQKNVAIYLNQIVEKLEKNIRSCRCNYVRCIVTPTYKDISKDYFDVEISNYCVGKVLSELYLHGFKIYCVTGNSNHPKEFIVCYAD